MWVMKIYLKLNSKYKFFESKFLDFPNLSSLSILKNHNVSEQVILHFVVLK